MTYDQELYLRKSLADFGIPVGESGLSYQQDSFTGNGATTVYTLSHTPASTFPTYLYLAGVLQKTSQVGISGTTVTFTAAPGNGVAILAIYQF